MFFVFSKILAFMFNPLVWVMLLLLWAMLSKKQPRKKKLLLITFLIFFLFGNSFLQNEAAILVEKKYRQSKPETKTTYGILLGGFCFYDETTENVHLAESGDRFFQAITLFNQGFFDTLVVSGGSGSLTKPEQKEAQFIHDYFVQNNWNTNKLIIEKESRNTRENALFTSNLIHDKSKPVYLISSGFHMKRAKFCFHKVGFEVIPYATNFISDPGRKYTFEAFIIPSPKAFMKWELIIKEWLGYVIYKIRGYC
jgi:uncharacterized SAM-binding protein YcdF (DUF218 family)